MNVVMKDYEVVFFNPKCPGEPGSMLIKARSEIDAVLEAVFCATHDYGMRYTRENFLVRETNLGNLTIAQKWSTDFYKVVDSPVAGFKQIVRK